MTTNRERADQLAVDSRKDTVSCVDLANLIEQALDEKDVECRKIADRYVDQAFIQGQREMREKAKGLEEALNKALISHHNLYLSAFSAFKNANPDDDIIRKEIKAALAEWEKLK